MKVLLSGNAEAETLRSEQTTLDRRGARNIIGREERVFFARFGATSDGRGSNDQKTDNRDQGGARRPDRRGGADCGAARGNGRRLERSADQSGACPAARRSARATECRRRLVSRTDPRRTR